MNLEQAEQEILSRIHSEWYLWRRYPEKRQPPDHVELWQVVRSLRNAQEYGEKYLPESHRNVARRHLPVKEIVIV